ncbi:hypothetical protein N665_0804s0013 [Sinapis alba]|nr:hypothetical protein N665_0804s0013 [Sinapis alba]
MSISMNAKRRHQCRPCNDALLSCFFKDFHCTRNASAFPIHVNQNVANKCVGKAEICFCD